MNSKQFFTDLKPQHAPIVGTYAAEPLPPPAPIPRAMSQLTSRMEDLGAAIVNLARLLEPVLAPTGPGAVGPDDDAVQPVHSPMHDFLVERNAHCSQMFHCVQDLMNRLEV